MDERLKKKLELLGEPTLPDRLSAEELFRRMDSGELTLPNEEPEDERRKVIPWFMILRRGLPIAACLALVVLLSQTGLWKLGSPNGANLPVTSAAPQWEAAADQSASAEDDEALIESSTLDAEDDEAAPEADPRSITMADESAEEEALEDDLPELARQDGAQNGLQAFISDDRAEDSFASDSAPDTGGGFRPPSGSTEENSGSGFNPDCGAGKDDDWGNSNPDTGGGGDMEDDPVVARLWELLMELVDKLFKEDAKLAGLDLEVMGYSTGSDKFYGPIREIEIYVRCHNNETEERFYIYVHCSANWNEEEQTHTLVNESWEYATPRDSDDGGEPNPDTSGISPDDEWDPDPGTGALPNGELTPDISLKGGPDNNNDPDTAGEDQEQ